MRATSWRRGVVARDVLAARHRGELVGARGHGAGVQRRSARQWLGGEASCSGWAARQAARARRRARREGAGAGLGGARTPEQEAVRAWSQRREETGKLTRGIARTQSTCPRCLADLSVAQI
jgi:hypothetical protein